MKRLGTLFTLLIIASPVVWAMPTQITFQGTLKQDSVPVNTNTNMQFSFVDGTGATIPGTTPISVSNVQVTNGLFAVQLAIDQTVNWQAYTPYIQVSVQGQILSPNQPLTSNMYSMVAQTVVDGSITTAKIAAGAVTAAQLDPSVTGITVPSGMIAMFAGPCPSGWNRFSQLDNAFPMGSSSYGSTGGSATSATQHGVLFGSGQGSGSFWTSWKVGDSTLRDLPVSTLPPYVTMVYCIKS